MRISSIILDFSGGIAIVALFLTMLVAIVLGMGMPTSAAYIIMAALLAPGLAKMGVDLIAAHMFIIFCAAMSGITPPVAISSFAAAAIAGSNPWRTSWVAIRLGLSVYIVPYMFVYGPSLLGFGTSWEIATTLLSASIGIVALSIAVVGWFKVPLLPYERLIIFVASLNMIYSGFLTDLIGMGLCGVFGALIYFRLRHAEGATTSRDAS